MKNYDEIIASQKELSDKREQNKQKDTEKGVFNRFLTTLAKVSIDRITKSLYKVELTNEKDLEPALRDIEKAVSKKEVVKEVTVKNLKDIVIPESKETVKVSNLSEIKIPEVKIPSSVKVSNLNEIKFPEINIPEQKEVDFTVLVRELKTLQKLLTTKETIDTSKMENTLSGVLSLLEKLLNKPEKEIIIPENDLTPLIAGLKSVKQSIQEIKFPVPTFNTKQIVDAIEHLESVLSGEINVNIDMATEGISTSAKQDEIIAAIENTIYRQIESANDNITTINYTDATKKTVNTIVQTSATVGATATETFDDSGETTLVITRGVV